MKKNSFYNNSKHMCCQIIESILPEPYNFKPSKSSSSQITPITSTAISNPSSPNLTCNFSKYQSQFPIPTLCISLPLSRSFSSQLQPRILTLLDARTLHPRCRQSEQAPVRKKGGESWVHIDTAVWILGRAASKQRLFNREGLKGTS